MLIQVLVSVGVAAVLVKLPFRWLTDLFWVFSASFYTYFYGSCFKSSSAAAGSIQRDTYARFLESKYEPQSQNYDVSRASLLPSREAFLRLVAAQVKYMLLNYPELRERKLVWVDVGGGTGWAVEALSAFLPIDKVFERIYVVDLTPSLLKVARLRMERLGLQNVRIIHADASQFRLCEWEAMESNKRDHADLITLSYALTIMPDFYPVVDMCEDMLSRNGIIAAVDFGVANVEDVLSRNYTAGFQNRHTGWLKRVFLLALADGDRTGGDAHRLNYLEYKFGNIFGLYSWEFHWRFIPYFGWLGCKKRCDSKLYNGVVAKAATKQTSPNLGNIGKMSLYEDVRKNLHLEHPLPSYVYQNHPWRLPYEDQLEYTPVTADSNVKATASRWKLASKERPTSRAPSAATILALQSDSDKVLEYTLAKPDHLIAVDPSPLQNHLLELKVAASIALNQDEFKKFFTTTNTSVFRHLMLDKISPHLSSRTLSWWLIKIGGFFNKQRTSIVSCNSNVWNEHFAGHSYPQAFDSLQIHTNETMIILKDLGIHSVDIIDIGLLPDLDHEMTRLLVSDLRRVLKDDGSLSITSQGLGSSLAKEMKSAGFTELESGYENI